MPVAPIAPDVTTQTTAPPAADAGLQQMLAMAHGPDFLSLLAVFVLAIFVGYYVVWRVTPALHSPLMAVTNAISSVIIVGALIAAGPAEFSISTVFGFLAVILASVNIFGGFLVTRRMLAMFRKKQR
ncbi:MAG: NAD(P) transhydrogenase subunit alpha [Alphaproteobacteria bacterium]